MISQHDLHIRRASQSHLQDVVDLISVCRQDLIDSGIQQWDDKYPNPDYVARDLTEGNLYIVLMNYKIVGTVALNQDQDPEYSRIPWAYPAPSLVIHRLCVSPSHQGRGIGSALMRFAERHAIDKGCHSIRLDVYSGNPNSVNIYTHTGYSIAGQFMFPSRRLPFYCMEKFISLDTVNV